MAKIRIVSVPEGEAPEWVRKAWVGLILPLAPKPPETPVRGVISLRVVENDGPAVPYEDALGILREANPDAADWFEETFWPDAADWFEEIFWYGKPRNFIFNKEACQLIPDT